MSTNLTWHPSAVERADRWAAVGSTGATVWFTGLSGAGKSTIAAGVERRLLDDLRPAYLLDGDNLRHGLNADLGFGVDDRSENVRRVAEVALLLADAGLVALVPVISPFRADRDRARRAHLDAGVVFLEVHVDTPLDVCEARDPKGLYARARRGEIRDLTGLGSPYERPLDPDVVVRAGDVGVDRCVDAIIDALLTAEGATR